MYFLHELKRLATVSVDLSAFTLTSTLGIRLSFYRAASGALA